MDLSEGHYGVSLLNDCKYGHSVKDSNMALTLIKSGIEPNPTTDQEEHFFTYALYPHAENWSYSETVYEAAKLNQPAYAVAGGVPGEEYSFASVNKKNVMIETVKHAEDQSGIIVRMYECENSFTKAHVTLGAAANVVSIEECNLLEEATEKIPMTNNGFDITIKPYEIKTYKIILKR
jgi:alpha-mannosidase